MTIPIVPGPFSFLEGAGEAAGAYAKAKEERQHHAEQIAEHGSNFIMQSILQGADPSVLDNPDVQKMMKTAYGFTFPSSVGRAIGAEARHKAKGFTAAEDAGVPKAEADAAAAAAKLAKERSTAESTTGVPTQDALTKVAIAKAQASGAQLNLSIFRGANALLGTDPKFAHLSYEAATGALDARLRYWQERRADLSIERQKMIDRLSIAKDELKEVGARFDKAQKAWETNLQTYLLEKGDTPANRTAFANDVPPPDENDIAEKYIQSVHGYGREEFQRRMNEITEELTKPNTTGTFQAQPGTTGGAGQAQPKGASQSAEPTPTQPPIATTKGQNVLKVLSSGKFDPETAGLKIAQAVQNEQLTDSEADVIVFRLRQTMPGDWFKKFNAAYKLGPKP